MLNLINLIHYSSFDPLLGLSHDPYFTLILITNFVVTFSSSETFQNKKVIKIKSSTPFKFKNLG